MNEQHHGNLLAGATGETTQTAAQLATIAATAAQTVACVRARRLAADAARDENAADAQRAVLRSEHAPARLGWAPGLERSFTAASAAEAAAVWAAAQPWAEHDTSAREAARLAGERLGSLHPELIMRYQKCLADGRDPVDAMVEATGVLTPSPGDVNAAAAALAVAGDERDEALRDAAVPDLAATPSVDEHTQGVHAGATHAAVSDASSARAALLAAQAYPRQLRGPLGGAISIRAPRSGSGQALYWRRGR